MLSALMLSCRRVMGSAGAARFVRDILGLVQPEEVAHGVDDTETAAVLRRRTHADGGLVEKLVHERSRELLDRRLLVGRERPHLAQRMLRLPRTHELHLAPEAREHGNDGKTREPLPEALRFLADQ